MSILLFFFLILTVFSKPRDVEIVEDFSLDLEYALGTLSAYLRKN
jgi:hypothetical protein